MNYEGALGGNSVSHTHRVPSSDEQFGSIALCEILGIPPNADSRTLRLMIFSLKTTGESQASANGTMETPHTNVVHRHQSMLASYSLPMYTQTNPVGLQKQSGGFKRDWMSYSTRTALNGTTSLKPCQRFSKSLFSCDDKLNILYSNMRPEYKLTMKRQECRTISDMILRAEQYEEYFRVLNTYRPPPPPPLTLVPETAYHAKKKFDKSHESSTISESGVTKTKPIQGVNEMATKYSNYRLQLPDGKRTVDSAEKGSPESLSKKLQTNPEDWQRWLRTIANFSGSVQSSRNMNNRPHIEIEIHDSIFSALVDIGETMSMVGKSLAEHLRRNGNVPFKRPMKIQMADGSQKLLEEYYTFEALICYRDTTHKFEALCVPSLTSDLIVGVDSIKSLGLLTYDFLPQTRPEGNIFFRKSDVGDVRGLNQLSEDEQEVLDKFLRE
ncbi:hypothetical protein J6590_009022 [Homalodisca vitripennis]|nr:hypothetical protein J6590_009022 [Homalodisca vitripennis]